MAEKSSTKLSTRITIIVGALVFLISSLAFSVFVIIDLVANKDTASSSQDVKATACDIQTPVPSPAIPAPEIFKPEGDVTELQKTDLVVGTGAEAKTGDCVVTKYYGTLADGTMFDENFTKDTALQFKLGTGSVIPGWDQGVAGMKVGGERRLVIPSNLAYGETGSPPTIPANADLVFVVKLVDIKE